MESLIFFLTISLLSNHNIKNRHIDIITSKLDTINTYSNLFKNTFQEFFLCSVKSRDPFHAKWSCVLRNGVNIFVSDIKFTFCINKAANETISRILLNFFLSCAEKSRDSCLYDMKFHFTKWKYNICFKVYPVDFFPC